METHIPSNIQTIRSVQIGVSRPPLEVEDLPLPEEVFKVKRIGLEELILFVLGPSLIALGISVGSGEWMLGPLNIGTYGFRGIGWVILISAVLQVFYNVELARFTVATGEPPILAFGRTPPGYYIWVPLALISFYMAFILGGWATSAGSSLFALFAGRANLPEEAEFVRILSIGLMLSTFFFVLIGKKIERSLEGLQGIILVFTLISLVLVTLVVVPISFWGEAVVSLVTPAAPPRGSDPSLLGALAGFTALASGLNFMIIGYYRDKGYGMGYRTGYLSGLISGGERERFSFTGKTFPENEENAAIWKRWFRYLLIDQWVVYFFGAMIGMLVPCILIGYLASSPGAEIPTSGSILVYAAQQLGIKYGPVLYGWALLIGFAFLYSTQIIVLELLARNFTDATYGVSSRLRAWLKEDPRKLYYTTLILVIIIVGVLIHLALPQELIVLSGNLANFAALLFPLVMIYLNRQLPRPARSTWWSHLALLANVIFFGFFFINFIVSQVTGSPLVRF